MRRRTLLVESATSTFASGSLGGGDRVAAAVRSPPIGVRAPDLGAAKARLCLYLADTPAARRLADAAQPKPTIYDIADERNAQGIKPFDDPQRLDIAGLELREARWARVLRG